MERGCEECTWGVGDCRGEVEVVYMIYITYRDFGMVVLSTCVKEERGKGGETFGLAFF